MTERFAPALGDPVVQEHAAGYYLVKRPESDAGVPRVDLALFAPPEAEAVLGAAVARHAAGPDVSRGPVSHDDPVLHPVFQEYREGLADVTAIALDLHQPDHLHRHQWFLIGVGCRPEDPRFALHPYLAHHSAAYRNRSGTDPSGRWSWAHERFWARCYTPGPDPAVGAPLRALWNVVVGVTPRRGDVPSRLAERLAIACQ